jgi:phospholipid/cholesterol/gamma-HCH transport system substrate-binding protein/paraquat-inducible protein B
MSVKTGYFKIGMFIIIATCIAVIGIAFLGAGTMFRKKVMVESYFQESVQGLEVGSPLKFRGVRFGKVEEITLLGKEYLSQQRYILVRVSMPSEAFVLKTGKMSPAEFQTEIDKGLRVRLAFHGLTGTAFLEMDYLNPVENPPMEIDWTPRHIYIPSSPSTITRISVSLEKIMKNLEGIRIHNLFEDLEESAGTIKDALAAADIAALSAETKALLGEARETNRNLHRLLDGAEIKGLISKTTAAAGSVKGVLDKSEKPLLNTFASLSLASEAVAGLIRQYEGDSGNLTGTLGRLEKVLGRIDGLMKKKEQDLEMIVDNFRVFSENIRELSENAKKNPSMFFLGKPPPPITHKKK